MGSNDGLTEAVILAGGKGTRLQGVVRHQPKPMAGVAGRPFAEWLILQLKSCGIRRIVFCTGFMGDAIKGHFQDGLTLGVELGYSQDPFPLGTGGAVRHALAELHSNRFLVMNGDSYCRFHPDRLLATHVQSRAKVTLWLTRAAGNRFGAVEIDEEGAVRAFREKPADSAGHLVNAGIYLMDRRAIESIPPKTNYSLEYDLFPSMIGEGLSAVAGDDPMLDIGTPESYAAADEFFKEHILSR